MSDMDMQNGETMIWNLGTASAIGFWYRNRQYWSFIDHFISPYRQYQVSILITSGHIGNIRIGLEYRCQTIFQTRGKPFTWKFAIPSHSYRRRPHNELYSWFETIAIGIRCRFLISELATSAIHQPFWLIISAVQVSSYRQYRYRA